MFFFIAAKHASHALPVKIFQGPFPLKQKVRLARMQYHQVSENPENTGS